MFDVSFAVIRALITSLKDRALSENSNDVQFVAILALPRRAAMLFSDEMLVAGAG